MSNEELLVERYARQIILPGVGRAGQLKLQSAKVLIVGMGGLGNPVGLYLASCGLGCIGIIDHDRVDRSNLQRQIIFGEGDVGSKKVDVAERKFKSQNENIRTIKFDEKLTEENAKSIISDFDLVVECTDSLDNRQLVNNVCLDLRVPWIYGSVFQFEGQVSKFESINDSPCYNCLYPQKPENDFVPSCSAGGVIGVVPGLVGLLQANEAIKHILQLGDSLSGRLHIVDALSGITEEIRFSKNPDCPTCGNEKRLPSQELTPDLYDETATGINTQEWYDMMQSSDKMNIIDVRDPGELELAKLDGAVNIPVYLLPHQMGKFNAKLKYVTICKSGFRAKQAAHILKSNGIKESYYFDGSIETLID